MSGNRAVAELFLCTSSRAMTGPRRLPPIRAVGGLELEQRGPSFEGSRQVIAVKTRGFPGPGASQPHDSADNRLSGFARQGLQEKS